MSMTETENNKGIKEKKVTEEEKAFLSIRGEEEPPAIGEKRPPYDSLEKREKEKYKKS